MTSRDFTVSPPPGSFSNRTLLTVNSKYWKNKKTKNINTSFLNRVTKCDTVPYQNEIRYLKKHIFFFSYLVGDEQCKNAKQFHTAHFYV